ncbi:dihydrofolate reductase family protein [Clostridium thermobutyricum]|uniref:dihydrofolate reductase family protein n=1 Tax=Clostridium thermobutyricum TaxID=29372 RepID=UPI0009AE606D|nr:dihydrofolate reductase family protein [Clostridium thermobutyricum]
MSRKIILNLAMSLDGFIADEDGGYNWITGDGRDDLNTDEKWNYDEFLEEIDIVVMGKRCYDQGFHNDYSNKTIYVATNEDLEDYDNVKFIKNDIDKFIMAEKEKEGRDIFLFGGGVTIDSFIKKDIIDEYIIGIIPTILGKGRPLFFNNNPKINLQLNKYIIDNGVIVLKYSKRY